MKEAIAKNVTTVVNSDPRIVVSNIVIDSYESGIVIDVDLMYLPYNISESLRLTFDEESGSY